MAIKPEYIVRLQGKSYPLWAGILNAATEAGLCSLTTRIVQAPSEENGQMAIVEARAEFKDGRVFQDVGDCSPKSLGPKMQHLAPAATRMASTRAKGRCLRDALNVGETMFEELPDGEPGEEQADRAASRARGTSAPARPAPAAAAADAGDEPLEHFCADCGAEIVGNEKMGAAQIAALGVTRFGRALCPPCGKALTVLEKARVPTGQIA